jgi:hypothetical protein
METKHSKGVWKQYTTSVLTEAIDISQKPIDSRYDLHYEEAISNAKLIAAAPEMIETLNNCLETINIMLTEIKKDEVILRHELESRKKNILRTIEKATE